MSKTIAVNMEEVIPMTSTTAETKKTERSVTIREVDNGFIVNLRAFKYNGIPPKDIDISQELVFPNLKKATAVIVQFFTVEMA